MGMMGMPNPAGSNQGMPPVPPDVAAQQQQQIPAMSQFSGQGQGQQGDPSLDFARQKMDEVALSMTQVAKIISAVKPELMPLIQKMAMAGSMIMNELTGKATPSGNEPPLSQPQATGPDQMGLGA